MIRKASTILVVVVIIAIVLTGGAVAVMIVLKKRADKRKNEELIMPFGPDETAADNKENEVIAAGSAESKTDEAQEDN